MSKRDELRKLKERQKQSTSAKSTPAENVSKAAAEATSQIPQKEAQKEINEPIIQNEVKIENTQKFEPQKEITPEVPTSNKNIEIEEPVITTPKEEKTVVIEKTENVIAETVPEVKVISDPIVQPENVVNQMETTAEKIIEPEIKETAAAPAPQIINETPTIPEAPIQTPEKMIEVSQTTSETKTVDLQTYQSVTNLPGKRISVSLITENKNWMHRTAIRCGLSIQDYMNILVEEAWEREKLHPYVVEDLDILPERLPSSKTVLVAIKLSENNIKRTKRLRASHCMTMTGYMNFLIEQEREREKREGARIPIFDEDL